MIIRWFFYFYLQLFNSLSYFVADCVSHFQNNEFFYEFIKTDHSTSLTLDGTIFIVNHFNLQTL